MIRQKDFMSFDVKDGAVVLMDNGDMATISDVPAGWGIYVTQPDGTRFLHETAKSKHVITCLVYVYPDTNI